MGNFELTSLTIWRLLTLNNWLRADSVSLVQPLAQLRMTRHVNISQEVRVNLRKHRANGRSPKSGKLHNVQSNSRLSGAIATSQTLQATVRPGNASRRRYAIHEAGHAVAALAMGGSIVRLQIAGPKKPVIRRDGAKCAGVAAMVDTMPFAWSTEKIREIYFRIDVAKRVMIEKMALGHAFVSLGGPAAEARGQGTDLSRLDQEGTLGAASDFRMATYHLRPFASDELMLAELLAVMSEGAEQLFSVPAVWNAVEAVAEAALSGVEEGSQLTRIARAHLPLQLPVAPLLANVDQIEDLVRGAGLRS